MYMCIYVHTFQLRFSVNVVAADFSRNLFVTFCRGIFHFEMTKNEDIFLLQLQLLQLFATFWFLAQLLGVIATFFSVQLFYIYSFFKSFAYLIH